MKLEIPRVFVYGTLLRGESNHYLLAGAEFIGKARTGPEFVLVDLGPYPAMLEGGQTAVSGEVYAVGEDTLRRLDRLEGHPDFYVRKRISLDDGQEVETYVLAGNQIRSGRILHAGDWRSRHEHETEINSDKH